MTTHCYPGLDHRGHSESCRGCNVEHTSTLYCRACVERMHAETLVERIRELLRDLGHSSQHAYTVNTATSWWLDAHPAYVETI